MSNDLENRLRAALRPVEPGAGFAERVLARVARGDARRGEAHPGETPRRPRRRLPGALAASLVALLIGGHFWQQHRERVAGLEARQQLLEALRVTSEKLDIAYDGVHSQSRRDDEENPGA